MKIGMTGSREGISSSASDTLTRFKVLNKDNITEAHHGDCIGADENFHNNMVSSGIQVVIHPPDQNVMRAFCKGGIIRKAFPFLVRNHHIVDETGLLLAFPSTKKEILRSGTWATIRYAKKTNKKVIIIFPDGTCDFFGGAKWTLNE